MSWLRSDLQVQEQRAHRTTFENGCSFSKHSSGTCHEPSLQPVLVKWANDKKPQTGSLQLRETLVLRIEKLTCLLHNTDTHTSFLFIFDVAVKVDPY